MQKYYTRACNFYHGRYARKLLKKKQALPLCGNKDIVFNQIEIISRKIEKLKHGLLVLKNIKNLAGPLKKKKVKLDINHIISKRKNFFNYINFSKPTIMGIINLTPDSFSDGGKYNRTAKAEKHISQMIKAGAKIVDVGGESTRPGSKTIPEKTEWKRIKKYSY